MIRQIKNNKIGIHYMVLPVPLIFLTLLLSLIEPNPNTISAEAGPPARRVNMPYLGGGPPVELFEPAIFWFGQVDPTTNYADVRMWYYDEHVKLYVNIIDRLLWYDKNPTSSELSEWDAVTLYINLDGNIGGEPGLNSYRLVGQLNWFEGRANWQTAYRGNGTTWVENTITFTTDSGYRGAHNNDTNDKGWSLTVIIPFASLGLSSQPPDGTVWGLGVSLHDRDSFSGSPAIPDQIWPEQMNPDNPSTWGQLHFGRSSYEPLELLPIGKVIIQQGLNGASVPDAHVGGSFECGNNVDHWSEWGEANYAGSTQINVQNQWDISDYPCFSKYYVTFPLDKVPTAETILSARLTMTRFGGAGGGKWGEPPDSYIHALTVGEDWSEASLNWNNAPLAMENISGTWVKPVWMTEQHHYSWDVTKAVVDALDKGEPLRLALYSIDGDRHSGKYFLSSDWDNWDIRPRLVVTWGIPCGIQGVECVYNYIPMVVQ